MIDLHAQAFCQLYILPVQRKPWKSMIEITEVDKEAGGSPKRRGEEKMMRLKFECEVDD